MMLDIILETQTKTMRSRCVRFRRLSFGTNVSVQDSRFGQQKIQIHTEQVVLFSARMTMLFQCFEGQTQYDAVGLNSGLASPMKQR